MGNKLGFQTVLLLVLGQRHEYSMIEEGGDGGTKHVVKLCR